ncbi:Hypothetical protein A7982_07360 [Minicystis rosea]|nr:Hypothetical protein A7982_07360 [Minicystis rosea]
MRVKHRVLVAAAGLMTSLLALSAGCGGGEGGTGGSTGGSGGGSGGAADTPNCDEYCTKVTTNCTGATAVYTSKEVCVAACKYIPVGTAADTTGNTLGCRTYHAGAAAGSTANATLHCPHAGPGGAEYCGSNCDGYCNLAMGACPSLYSKLDDCLTTCATFTDTEPFTSQVSGNTLQCRLYHASVAAGDDTHCDHIGTSPSPGTCTDP